MRILADECCPKAIVSALRAEGHDVAYAAETAASFSDDDLLGVAFADRRIILTEDFDFEKLLIRDRRRSWGAVILFLPQMPPAERAVRLANVLKIPDLDLESAITIVEARRIRQRRIES